MMVNSAAFADRQSIPLLS
ncbi:Protein of unknown function [Pyronema omphalodes CBS 100304]|uniref:Uncharacterized protein n=1 Tax=Pyronema omphalodes (strain CBS 100304) TaxID=1076935 RepID=U4L0U5_PYROM|nr:Protein of unknown function [Pyronema omphalodes CBS 100304]